MKEKASDGQTNGILFYIRLSDIFERKAGGHRLSAACTIVHRTMHAAAVAAAAVSVPVIAPNPVKDNEVSRHRRHLPSSCVFISAACRWFQHQPSGNSYNNSPSSSPSRGVIVVVVAGHGEQEQGQDYIANKVGRISWLRSFVFIILSLIQQCWHGI